MPEVSAQPHPAVVQIAITHVTVINPGTHPFRQIRPSKIADLVLLSKILWIDIRNTAKIKVVSPMADFLIERKSTGSCRRSDGG
jgi:hypothetical protein